MVTALVIPILFAYFYYLTKKERKTYYQKWLNIGNIREESWVKGQIIDIHEKKQRYYHDYSISIIDVILQSGEQKVMARTRFPENGNVNRPTFQIGETIVCYGEWNNGLFLFKNYNTVRETTKV